MEHLPVQVIGHMLSLLDSAKYVIVASATCKKWREARHNHLHALYFDFDLRMSPRRLELSEVEIITTINISQTKGLQSLSILMDFNNVFSAAAVTTWLVYTRDTLLKLFFCARIAPSANILELCNRQKLEELEFCQNSIAGVGPVYMKFLALKSLFLAAVSISSLDLSLLLTMCPKLESLSLVELNITDSDVHTTMELNSASLKDISVESIGLENFRLDKFILDAASIEKVCLSECTLNHFELVTKGSLKVFRLMDVSILNLDIGENTCNLKVVDVSYSGNPKVVDANKFSIRWPEFYHMISRSSKLRKLRLWGVVFGDEDEVVNLETIAACFPQLSQLSLRYGLRDGIVHYGMQGSSHLQNVTVLEVGWNVISELFTDWVAGLLQRCPRLKNLVIYGIILEARTCEDSPVLAKFTTSIFQLMRKYIRVDVEFKYRGKLKYHAF